MIRRSIRAAAAAALLAAPMSAAPAGPAGPARGVFLPQFARSDYPGRSGQIMLVPYEGSNSQMYVDRARLGALGLTLGDVSRAAEALP